MDPSAVPSTGRKPLQDLTDVSRVPAVAYLQKQAVSTTPQPDHVEAQASTFYEKLSVFLPTNLWGWITEYFGHRFGWKHPFADYTTTGADNGVYPLEGTDEIRVALAGDWGTGTDEAFHIAERIKQFDPHYSIHLGDIYFVGERREVQQNFLGVKMTRFEPCSWPKGSKGTFALNGNHEMYARGKGYFELVLPRMGLEVDGRPAGQKASFMALRNDDWWIIGLDTGYRSIGAPILENLFAPDCALPDALVDWMRANVRPDHDKRGIILLGHHQYCSRFDKMYPRQAEQLAEFVNRPVLWFWGHEHRMAIYEKYQAENGIAAFGRCIGYGGMPVELPPRLVAHGECEIEFIDTRLYKTHEPIDVGVNGFVRLVFKGKVLCVDYVDIDDNVVFAETWTIDAIGAVQRTSKSIGAAAAA